MKKLFVIFGITITLLLPSSVAFASDACDLMVSSEKSAICEKPAKNSAKNTIFNVINTILGLVGSLSVVMIVYAGIQYVISAGDSGKVAKAKNIIIYAVVGLLIAVFSYTIVNFVVKNLV